MAESEISKELQLSLPHISITGVQWGKDDAPSIIALHGWLDNALSFQPLIEYLPNYRFISLDLAGHGQSGHRDGIYHFSDYVYDLSAVVEQLELDKFILLGHSLGGGIAATYAGLFPKKVTQLILLDSLGPGSGASSDTRRGFIRALKRRQRYQRKTPTVIYPDVDAAIEARDRVGDVPLEALRNMLVRSLEIVPEGVRLRQDPGLRLHAPLRMSESQVLNLLEGIEAPCLYFRALSGHVLPESALTRRKSYLKSCQQVELEGGHHVHLEHPADVAEYIQKFLEE
ncbi:MAG: alpha/beta hydrolase [Pseudomonadota bacterium]